MTVKSTRFRLSTKGEVDIFDITAKVTEAVRSSGIHEGIACVATVGSTAAVTTMENEHGLVQDLRAAIERLIPQRHAYKHNSAGDDNGHSHLRSTLLGTSVTLPVSEGRPVLGKWQQVLFVELDDRPRDRELFVQVIGE